MNIVPYKHTLSKQITTLSKGAIAHLLWAEVVKVQRAENRPEADLADN